MNLLGVTDNRMNELRVAGWRWVDKFLFIEKRRLGFLGRINGSSNGSLKSGSFARSSFANSSVLPHFLVSILLSLRALFLFRPRALLLALPLLTCGGSPTAWALPAPTDGFANYPTKLSVLLGKVPGNVAANASAYLLPYGTRATPQLACQQIIGDGGAALFSAQTGASVTPTSTVLSGQAPEFQCAASRRKRRWSLPAPAGTLGRMNDPYRRLAVFVDHPSKDHFLWVIIESTDDPSVWLDLETGDNTYDSWIEAHEAGNEALMAYVDDEAVGPVGNGGSDDADDADNDD